MSLNIGTLVGYLQLDDANFERKADAADRKINALQLHLKALAKENPRIGVEVTAQTAELDALKLKLEDLKAQAANGVDVRVDAVQALIELDRVQTKIRELHGKTIDVKVDVDKSQIAEGTSVLDKFGGSLSVIPALAVAAGAALIPLVATIGGVVAALAAPLAFAAGGAGLFALIGGLAVKQTLAQTKALDKLKGQVDSAKVSLENARRSAGKNASTSASVAAAQERLNKATADYQSALKGISPEQAGFVRALDGLKGAFSDILHGPTGRSVLTVLTDGVQLLTYVLRDSGPLIRAASSAFGTLLTDLGQAVSSPGFTRFLHMASGQIRTDLVAFGHILGNLGRGLGGLFAVLAGKHFSGSVLQGLTHLSREFANWGNSKAARHDVRDLFEYVHKVGPQVGSTLGAIARAAGHLVAALAPLGPPVLKVVEGIANAISRIPVQVLTALAAAFVAMTAAAKIGKGLSAIGGLSSLTLGGGGGPVGKLLGGVQKVYVVNLPPGLGGGGGGGGIGGRVRDAAKRALPFAGGLTATDLAGGAAGALSAAGILGLTGYSLYSESKSGPGNLAGGMTPAQWAAYNRKRLNANTGLGPGTITHPTNPVHQLNREIGAVSQNLDLTGARGAQGFAQAAKEAHHLSMELAAIQDPKIRSVTDHVDTLKARLGQASQAVDLVGPHAAAAFGSASKDVDMFRSKLAAIQDKKIAVILQDQAAIQSLEALQNLRLHDKTMTVTTIYQQRERVVGPGGGIGHHAGGGEIRGPGTGTSDSVLMFGSNGEFVIKAAQYAANKPLVQAINNGSGRVSLASAGSARAGYTSAPLPARYGLTITNWDEGTGYIEAIASDVHAADHRYATAVGRN